MCPSPSASTVSTSTSTSTLTRPYHSASHHHSLAPSSCHGASPSGPTSVPASASTVGQRPSSSSLTPSPASSFLGHSSSSTSSATSTTFSRPPPMRAYRYKLRWRNGVDLNTPYSGYELAELLSSRPSTTPLSFPPRPPSSATPNLPSFLYCDPDAPSPVLFDDTATFASASLAPKATAEVSVPPTLGAVASDAVTPTAPTAPETKPLPTDAQSRGRNQQQGSAAPSSAPTPRPNHAAPATITPHHTSSPASSAPTKPVDSAASSKKAARSRSRPKEPTQQALSTHPPPPVPSKSPAVVSPVAPPPTAKVTRTMSWAQVAQNTPQPNAVESPVALAKPEAEVAPTPKPLATSALARAPSQKAPSVTKPPVSSAPSLSTSTTMTVDEPPPPPPESSRRPASPKEAVPSLGVALPALQFIQPNFFRPTSPDPSPVITPASTSATASPTPVARSTRATAAGPQMNGHVALPSTPPRPASKSKLDVQQQPHHRDRDGSPTPTAPRTAPVQVPAPAPAPAPVRPAAPFSWAAAAATTSKPPVPATPSPPTVQTAAASGDDATPPRVVPTIDVTSPTPTTPTGPPVDEVPAPPSAQVTPVAPKSTKEYLASTDSTPTAPTAAPAAPAAGPTDAPTKVKPPAKPVSWAALFSSGSASKSPASSSAPAGVPAPTGLVSLGDLAATYTHDYVGGTLVPRGLVNNGNMCFLNVILQPLVHCPPFRNLLSAVNKRVVAKIADKPDANAAKLIEAFVAFLGEYVSTGADVHGMANGVGEAGERTTGGESLVPEPIYDVVRDKKARSLVKGRQEDAEEFLGFLLDGLHDEFVAAIKQADEVRQRKATANGTDAAGEANGSEWLEVGTKHRTAVTRSVAATESPITHLFTGRMRNTLRVPGQKDSVTIEPFQSLPLDISPDHVVSVVDAMREIIRPEVISEYPLPGGRGVVTDGVVTKQAMLERLPPILVMHLKRFLFDAARGDTVKVTKHVDVPMRLELEPKLWADKVRHQARAAAAAAGTPARSRTPSPVRPTAGRATSALSPTRFSALAPPLASSTPLTPGGSATGTANGIGPHSHYRLFAIVYHHGRAANGGHYTCDVLESEREGTWVRMDDTELQRVTTADVAAHKHDREPYLLFYECAELVERVERPRGRPVGQPPAAAPPARAKSQAGSRASSVGAPAAKTGDKEPVPPVPPVPAVDAPGPDSVTQAAATTPATAHVDEQADVDRAIAASLADSGIFPPQPPSPPSPHVEVEELPFTAVAKKQKTKAPPPPASGAARGGRGRSAGGRGAATSSERGGGGRGRGGASRGRRGGQGSN